MSAFTIHTGPGMKKKKKKKDHSFIGNVAFIGMLSFCGANSYILHDKKADEGRCNPEI